MPITSSAKKALRQNARRKERNDARKDSYKSAVKTLRSSISLKKEEEIKKLLSAANKALDKAAKGNTIAKNKASRLKSRLAQLVTRSSKASS
ncbi:MAG: 30S ribosomal protein S20 [Patescibacteria group bacterium]